MSDLREVLVADVHKVGQLAGQLTRDGDDVAFAYLHARRAELAA